MQDATEILHQKEGELEALRGRIFAQVVASRSNIPKDSPPPYEDQPPPLSRSEYGENAEDVPSEGDSTPSGDSHSVMSNMPYETEATRVLESFTNEY